MTGSSPLARGTLDNAGTHLFTVGLIPARAGNTSVLNAAFKELGAHPRSRGEHFMCLRQYRLRPGSSPLARGTHVAGHD